MGGVLEAAEVTDESAEESAELALDAAEDAADGRTLAMSQTKGTTGRGSTKLSQSWTLWAPHFASSPVR